MYWLIRLQFQQGWVGGGLSLFQAMLLSCDFLISEPFGNLVWAFWHVLWILRKCTWKFPELLRTRFQNWCIALPCCTGRRKTQADPDSREGETQFNSWCKQGKGSRRREEFLLGIFADNLHTQQQLSLKLCRCPRGVIPALPGTCASFTWGTSTVWRVSEQGFQVGLLDSKPGSPTCSLSNPDQVT